MPCIAFLIRRLCGERCQPPSTELVTCAVTCKNFIDWKRHKANQFQSFSLRSTTPLGVKIECTSFLWCLWLPAPTNGSISFGINLSHKFIFCSEFARGSFLEVSQTMKCHIIIAFIPLLLLVLQSSLSDAFSVSKHFTRSRTTTERLAWSLDIPENLGSFKSTWYNTVEYPTARRKVYDE